MRVALIAGAEVDIATPDEVKHIVRGALSRQRPIIRKPKGTTVIPTPTANTIIELGGPADGRMWDVRHVTVSGPDPTATIAGKAFICVGRPVNVAAGIDPFTVYTSTTAVPADAFISVNQLTVVRDEILFVVFNGVTAGTTVVAHAQVVDTSEETKETVTV
jgi:hypothetical protein